MKGLTNSGVKSIEKLIKSKFDLLSLRFLGILPTASQQKSIIFKTTRNNLVSLFLQALGTRDPNSLEERTLKTMLRIANGYMDGLRDRTAARVVHDIDSYMKNKSLQNAPIDLDEVNAMIDGELDKAGKHMKLIAAAESNKAINTGVALQISKMGKDKKEDPTVFFVVTHDDVTGPEEYVLHTLPDRVTPRVWKLSEIGSEYHKKGDSNPKFPGLHPNCRCKLTYLAKGFGFDDAGSVKYIDKNHDEFEAQREKYGLPR